MMVYDGVASYSQWLDLCGRPVRIQSDSARWLAAIDRFIPLPRLLAPQSPAWEIRYREAGRDELEALSPLPAASCRTSHLYIQEPIALEYSVYAAENAQWYDWSGVGRVYVDTRAMRTEVVVLAGQDTPEVFKIILLVERVLGRMIWPDFCAIHAGWVRLGGRGVLLAGPSGAGKSTATYALLQHGLPVMADDIVYVGKRQGYVAVALTNIIKVRQAAIEKFFPAMPAAGAGFTLADETYLSLPPDSPPAAAGQPALEAIIAIEQSGRPESRLERVAPLSVVGAVFPVTLFDPDSQKRTLKFRFVTEMLNNLECYRLHFGTDMRRFTDLLEEWGGQPAATPGRESRSIFAPGGKGAI